jgi:hypothetical protein
MRPATRFRAPRVPRTLLALALALPIAAAPLGAQLVPGEEEDIDEQAVAAYTALTTTPVGALPPSMTARMINGAASPGIGFRFHFGHMDEEGDFSRRNLAGGIDLPIGTATLGLTGGYSDMACDDEDVAEFGVTFDCGGLFMAGANLFTPLVSNALGEGSSIMMGLDAALGFGTGEVIDIEIDDGFQTGSANYEVTSLSAALAFPIALVVRQPGIVLVPHLKPGFGYGRAKAKFEARGDFGEDSGEETEAGTRFLLGGGVSMLFPRQGFGIEVGMQKVFVEDGDTIIGFGITFGR